MGREDRIELYRRVAAMRAETFELVDALSGSLGGRVASGDLADVTMRLQQVANQLGAIEEVVGPPPRLAA